MGWSKTDQDFKICLSYYFLHDLGQVTNIPLSLSFLVYKWQ